MRGKEGAGPPAKEEEGSAVDGVSVPLRGKEGAGLKPLDLTDLNDNVIRFRPLAG